MNIGSCDKRHFIAFGRLDSLPTQNAALGSVTQSAEFESHEALHLLESIKQLACLVTLVQAIPSTKLDGHSAIRCVVDEKFIGTDVPPVCSFSVVGDHHYEMIQPKRTAMTHQICFDSYPPVVIGTGLA